jgi:hypothetical protein
MSLDPPRAIMEWRRRLPGYKTARGSGVRLSGAKLCCTSALLLAFGSHCAQPQRLVPLQVPVPPTFFGMHIHHIWGGNEPNSSTPWPQVRVGAWRLWDVRVTWTDIEPSKGEWKFGDLDKLLEFAREHHTEVQLTFGFTPGWASARPAEPSVYRPGGAAEPRSADDWIEFVRTVAARYRGRIHIYEIWNEPNVKRYWSGSVEQMAEMTHQAHDIIKGIDPSATIVSPAPTGENGIVWLSSFLHAGGGRYVDVVGYHFYVFPAAPEAMVPLIHGVETVLGEYEISQKPLWDTEAGWAKPAPFPSEEMAAAYLARAFLLNWATGVQRFYWYAWDNHNFVSLQTTEADGKTLKPAGVAFGKIQTWMTGAVVNWCDQDRKHTWTCQLKEGNSSKWIAWNPDQSICLAPSSDLVVRSISPLVGQERSAGPGCVQVGPVPELLTR